MSHLPRRPSLWTRLVGLGFRLLYNELAWLYDPVSWLASFGYWRAWQRTALTFLPAGCRVLEVGCGPGHMLVALARAGCRPAGLDQSCHMLRLARRRLRRAGIAAGLVCARAECLPFSTDTFDAVLLTFPTPFVYDPRWLERMAAVLRAGGRVVVVEAAFLNRHDVAAQGLECLYRITGQRGTPPDLPALLEGVGLKARRAEVEITESRVSLVIADKPG